MPEYLHVQTVAIHVGCNDIPRQMSLIIWTKEATIISAGHYAPSPGSNKRAQLSGQFLDSFILLLILHRMDSIHSNRLDTRVVKTIYFFISVMVSLLPSSLFSSFLSLCLV